MAKDTATSAKLATLGFLSSGLGDAEGEPLYFKKSVEDGIERLFWCKAKQSKLNPMQSSSLHTFFHGLFGDLANLWISCHPCRRTLRQPGGVSAGRVAAEGMKSNDNGGFNTWFIAQTSVHFWVAEEAG